MAVIKSLVSLSSTKAALLLLLIAVAVHTQIANAQNCTSEMTSLNACAPFVVPGAASTTPSTDCCAALQSVDHDCFCNTVRIAARLPTQCNLPSLTCTLDNEESVQAYSPSES